MIRCTLEPRSIAENDTLKGWLGKGAFEILMRVIEAKVKFHEAEYLKDSLASGPDNDKAASAAASLIMAQYYSHAATVIKELSEQKEPYQIAKLS